MSLEAGDNLSLRKVVIDPGHGGKDPGCVSKDKKTYEKTINLDICNKLASKIREQFPDVEVVMTRSTDKTVNLDKRASIANQANADLFISIHSNSVVSTSPNGYSVHVLGKSQDKNRDLFAYNMEICRRENSVIQLEEDYSTKYQGFDPSDPESYIFMTLMQNAYLEQSLLFAQILSSSMQAGPVAHNRGVSSDPFLVLWMTSMPAVLVELGFLSNSGDLSVLRSETNREKIADLISQAFAKYKRQYDRSLILDQQEEAPKQMLSKTDTDTVAVQPSQKTLPAFPTSAKPKQSEQQYGIQIFAGSKLLPASDPAFMGYTPKVVKLGSVNKYIISLSSDIELVKKNLPSVKKKYKDAFLVKVTDDGVELYR